MKTCCVIGHRDFEKTIEIEQLVRKIIIDLIKNDEVTGFLFGSKSKFSDFCYDIITELIATYPKVKRIFIRAEYPVISKDYYNYLKNFYEDTCYYSDKLVNNKFSYVRRNQFMIDKSNVCLFYFNKNYIPKTKTQSGTRLAYDYAIKKSKSILNVFSCKI